MLFEINKTTKNSNKRIELLLNFSKIFFRIFFFKIKNNTQLELFKLKKENEILFYSKYKLKIIKLN